MRYVVFAGYADYCADMRNAKRGIHLRYVESSNYSADMRKSKAYNKLRLALIWRT
jgi:hypothetical protein